MGTEISCFMLLWVKLTKEIGWVFSFVHGICQ